MDGLKPGQPLPAWFVARSLLDAARDLGPELTARRYTEWRGTRSTASGRRPASASVIAARFGGWRAAVREATEALGAPDATRRVTLALHDRAAARPNRA